MSADPIAFDGDAIVLTIGMEYDGVSLSKNRLWHGGNRRAGMNAIASAWKKRIEESVSDCLRAVAWQAALPVSIVVSAAYSDRRNAVDVHNLLEIIADAVQDGCGLNDLDFATQTLRPTFGAALPTITIVVRIGRATPLAPAQASGARTTRQRKGKEGETSAREPGTRPDPGTSIPRRRRAVKS